MSRVFHSRFAASIGVSSIQHACLSNTKFVFFLVFVLHLSVFLFFGSTKSLCSIAYAAMADIIHEAAAIVPDPTQIDVKLFNRWSFEDIQVLHLSNNLYQLFLLFKFNIKLECSILCAHQIWTIKMKSQGIE